LRVIVNQAANEVADGIPCSRSRQSLTFKKFRERLLHYIRLGLLSARAINRERFFYFPIDADGASHDLSCLYYETYYVTNDWGLQWARAVVKNAT